MSLSDFIFGVAAGPVAPIVQAAMGKNDKDSISGALTGAAIAGTTLATIASFGSSAPAAASADSAIISSDAAAIGSESADVGASAADASATASSAAADTADTASTVSQTAADTSQAADTTIVSPSASVGNAGASMDGSSADALSQTVDAAGQTPQAPTTAVDAGTSTPEDAINTTADNQTMSQADQTANQYQQQDMADYLKGKGAYAPSTTSKLTNAARLGLTTASSTQNAINSSQQQQASLAHYAPQPITMSQGGAIPLPSSPSIVNTTSQLAPTQNLNPLQPLSSPGPLGNGFGTRYNTIFGSAPMLSPPPAIQPPPLTMSDRQAKTSIQPATRSIKDFLNQLRSLNAIR